MKLLRRILIAALLAAGCRVPARALVQQQAVPDAPQPQKKPATKPVPAPDPQSDSKSDPESPNDKTSSDPAPDPKADPDSDSGSSNDKAATTPAKPASGKDNNAFPEAVSRDAAGKAAQEEKQETQGETPSGAATGQKTAGGDKNARPASEANPFPEDISRDAAKAAGGDAPPAGIPKNSPPPAGTSSSQSSSLSEAGDEPHVADPARAQKDASVGTYYLQTKNYEGALLRFQDASKADPANVDAIFGMAEAQRNLGKTGEAARNYQLYLDIVPSGAKAKESMKALKVLQAQK